MMVPPDQHPLESLPSNWVPFMDLTGPEEKQGLSVDDSLLISAQEAYEDRQKTGKTQGCMTIFESLLQNQTMNLRCTWSGCMSETVNSCLIF